MSGPRYAIYYAPPANADLWHFGSTAIGYDAVTGNDLPIPEVDGYAPDALAAMTADPRLYGFHATLKPPFHLADGKSEASLITAAEQFAAARSAFDIDLQLSAIGDFLALIPAAHSAPLHALADDCVSAFDPYRAPLTEADRARRLASPLGERQLRYLDQWGYPYVFEEFRFHMTLSGRLGAQDRARVAPVLAARYEAIRAPVSIDSVTIFVQSERGARFRILSRFPFAD